MKKVFYCVALLFLSISFICPKAWSQFETDKKLGKKLHALLNSFHGVAGIYARNLRTNKEVAINADTIFPTASIVKVPILVGIFNKLEQGVLTFHQPLVYHDSMARGGSGLMQFFKDTTKTDLSNVITLMITHSDNTAAVWCENLAGGGITINQWLTENGFQNTRLNARTTGRKADYDQYGWDKQRHGKCQT